MRSCLITTAQPVNYSRFYHREAVTLAASGIEVALIGLPAALPESSIPNITLYPIDLPGGIRKMASLNSVRSIAERINADVYHCFDPWALSIGLKMKRLRTDVKVVYDSTELFPALYSPRRDLPWPVRKLLTARIKHIERRAVREADEILETNATRAERFRQEGRKPVLIRNLPPRPAQSLSDRKRETSIVWTGLISYQRGFSVLLEAFSRIADELPLSKLRVFGRFDPLSNIEDRTREFIYAHKLDGRIELTDWLPYKRLLIELETCSIGVILLQPGRLNDYTGQPNKLFEFMGAGLAVIGSDFPEIGPILRDERCGLAVDPTDAVAVADAFRLLLTDNDLAHKMGRQGRGAVEREYNWDNAAAQLLHVYARMQ